MGRVGVDCSFWSSRDGILKTIEFIFSLVILILTSASNYTTKYSFNGRLLPTEQMAFVNFVGSFCCITLLISAIIYLLKLYNLPLCVRLPWRKMEMIFKFACALLNFVAMAVAANSAVGTSDEGIRSATFFPDFYELYTTVAIFATVVSIIFAVHGVIYYRGSPPASETAQRRSNQETNVNV